MSIKTVMTPSRPYLLEALWKWIVDNDFTPYIVVDINIEHVNAPDEYANQEGRIVLNIAPSAIRDLKITHKSLSFVTRFSGVETSIYAPMPSVLAIYAKENGKGMSFPEDEYIGITPFPPDDDGGGNSGGSGKSKGGSHLKIIK